MFRLFLVSRFCFTLIFVSFLLTNINFIKAFLIHSSDSFTTPSDGSTYTYNSGVRVTINFSSSTYVTVTQNCNGDFITLIIYNNNPSTALILPSNYIGSCTYSGINNLGLALIPVSINVKGTASFVLPYETANPAAGSNTDVQLSYSPLSQTIPIFSVKLFCPNNGYSPVTPVSGSSVTPFNVPPNFYGSCFFEATTTQDYVLTGNNNIVVTQPLTFLYPVSNSIIIQPTSLLINLQTGAITVPENVGLTLQSTTTIGSDLVVPTLSNATFYYPTNYIGQYKIFVNSASNFFVLPAPVFFNIKYALVFTIIPTTIYIGQQFSIQINTVPSSTITGNVKVNLVCGGSTVQTWDSVAVNTLLSLTAASTLTSQSGCNLQTSANDPNFIQKISTSIIISNTNVQLQFVSPLDGSTVLIPNPIPVFIDSTNVPNLTGQFNVSLDCQSSQDSLVLLVPASVTFNYLYDSTNYYGACSLNITDAPSNILAPSPLNLNLKFVLNFVNPPLVLKIGQYFKIQVNPSATLPSSFTSTAISLICSSQLIQTWQGVPYNKQVNLLLSGSVSPATGCTLSTISDTNFFVPATATVNVEFIESPFGGNLYPITESELVAFLSQFGAGWSIL